MTVHYDVQKLSDTLQDFYNATGVKIALARPDLSYLCTVTPQEHNPYCNAIQSTPQGFRACQCSDVALLKKCRENRQAEIHVCHAGLVDIAVPILYENEILGYVVLGQLKKERLFSDLPEKPALSTWNNDEMQALYDSLPLYDDQKAKSVLRIAVMLTKHILLENMLRPSPEGSLERAIAFIEQHLESALDVQTISKGAGLSKSALYQLFHKRLQCTVSEYVNQRRVERAIQLLRDSALSVEEIAARTGFSRASYFTRIFRRQTGTTPLKYRKSQQSSDPI